MKSKLLIGVICEKAHTEQNSGLIKGITAQAFRSDCDIVVLSAFPDNRNNNGIYRCNEMEIYRLILSDRFDGFLYMRSSFSSERICSEIEHLLLQTGRPVMMADGSEHNIFDTTASDDSRCFERITDHLIEVHDYRNIYFLSSENSDTPDREKIKGFTGSMKRHGLDCDGNSCIFTDMSASDTAGSIAKGKIPSPQAIVCADDRTAAALIEALCRRGINVPGDIAVTGFGSSVYLHFSGNITGYRRDLFQLGADSLRKLYRIITGNITPRTIRPSEGLHTGISCGCRPFSYNRFRQSRSELIARSFSEVLIGSRSAISCTDENSLEEALKKYCNDAFYIYRNHSFGICLSADYVNAVENLASSDMHLDTDSQMIRYMSRSSSGKISADRTAFTAADITPELRRSGRKPMAVFVNLLRNDRCVFGYTVLSFGRNYETYSKGYSCYLSGLDTVLDHFLKRSYMTFASDDPYSFSSSLFPLLYSIEKSYRNSPVTVITVEIRNIRQLFLVSENKDFLTAVSRFEKILKNSLLEGEKAAYITNGLYAVITDRPYRTEQIYKEIRSCDISSVLGKDHKITFSCCSNDNGSLTLSEAAKLSLKNDSAEYVIDGNVNPNPLYEKVCIIRERMRLAPQLDWNIGSISNELGISKSYLQKYYRSNFGVSIIDSLINMRIDMAKRLLRETDMTVTAIAGKCGYSSYIHFAKQFRKTVGYTPTGYRQQHRSEIEI